MTAEFSPSCERNKDPILSVLTEQFSNTSKVLEIGSGTGQHAVYFAPQLLHLFWQCSDLIANHPSILAWQQEQPSNNLGAPVEFCIGEHEWPIQDADAVFTANTTHIMQPDEAKLMMQLIAKNLPKNGVFCQYGPFNINGQFTSESNQSFDHNLKMQGYGGIRDIDELVSWGEGLTLVDKISMPANNMILIWKKR